MRSLLWFVLSSIVMFKVGNALSIEKSHPKDPIPEECLKYIPDIVYLLPEKKGGKSSDEVANRGYRWGGGKGFGGGFASAIVGAFGGGGYGGGGGGGGYGRGCTPTG